MTMDPLGARSKKKVNSVADFFPFGPLTSTVSPYFQPPEPTVLTQVKNCVLELQDLSVVARSGLDLVRENQMVLEQNRRIYALYQNELQKRMAAEKAVNNFFKTFHNKVPPSFVHEKREEADSLMERFQVMDYHTSGLVPGNFKIPFAWLPTWDEPADSALHYLDYRQGFKPVQPSRSYQQIPIGREFQEPPISDSSRSLVSVGRGFALLRADFDEITLQVNLAAEWFFGLRTKKKTDSFTQLGTTCLYAFFPSFTMEFGTFFPPDGYLFHLERYKASQGK
jgi:hypothetical protein